MPAPLHILADRKDNEMMSAKYTCDGDNEFPTLTLTNVDAEARSLALIVDDPDAPGGTRDHFLLANIPNQGTEMNITLDTASSALVGKNSRGRNDRWSPCPPSGTHRYFFKVYLLDIMLDLKQWFTKSQLLTAMQGHVLRNGWLVGLYKRK